MRTPSMNPTKNEAACQPFFPRRMYSVFVLHSPSKMATVVDARHEDMIVRMAGLAGRHSALDVNWILHFVLGRQCLPSRPAWRPRASAASTLKQPFFLLRSPAPIPPRTLPSSRIQHDAQLDYYSKRLATCSSDRKVKVFDVSGAEQVQIAELPGCVACVFV